MPDQTISTLQNVWRHCFDCKPNTCSRMTNGMTLQLKSWMGYANAKSLGRYWHTESPDKKPMSNNRWSQTLQHLTSWSRAYLSRAGVQATSLAATNVESIMTFRHRWCISHSWLIAESRRDSRTCLINDVSRAAKSASSTSHNSLVSHIVTDDVGRCGSWTSSSLSGLVDRKPRLDNWHWMSGKAWLSSCSSKSLFFCGTSLLSVTFTKNTASWLLDCWSCCRRLTSWSQHEDHSENIHINHEHQLTYDTIYS